MAIQTLCDKKQIIVREIHNKDLYHALETELDLGEAEVITLALEIKHDLILLDETEARRVAATYKLPLTGFIGILIKASSTGLLEDFKKTLDKAIALGFYINPRVIPTFIILIQGEILKQSRPQPTKREKGCYTS